MGKRQQFVRTRQRAISATRHRQNSGNYGSGFVVKNKGRSGPPLRRRLASSLRATKAHQEDAERIKRGRRGAVLCTSAIESCKTITAREAQKASWIKKKAGGKRKQ